MDSKKVTELQPRVTEQHCTIPAGSFTLSPDKNEMRLNCLVVDDVPEEVTSLLEYLRLSDQVNLIAILPKKQRE